MSKPCLVPSFLRHPVWLPLWFVNMWPIVNNVCSSDSSSIAHWTAHWSEVPGQKNQIFPWAMWEEQLNLINIKLIFLINSTTVKPTWCFLILMLYILILNILHAGNLSLLLWFYCWSNFDQSSHKEKERIGMFQKFRRTLTGDSAICSWCGSLQWLLRLSIETF